MMTELEVSAMAIAVAIDNSNGKGWGKEHAEQAKAFVSLQMKQGNVSPDDAFNAVARITGNQSAMAQSLEEWSLIERDRKGKSKPAIIVAVEDALPKVRDAKERAQLEASKLQKPAK